ncbi:hypothetical protein B0G69_8205 [Paraburkholderia sp. RAU2J]|nr:hypothetical protein B0G69_8205 [Paraburkholderia sp. RAU2J]
MQASSCLHEQRLFCPSDCVTAGFRIGVFFHTSRKNRRDRGSEEKSAAPWLRYGRGERVDCPLTTKLDNRRCVLARLIANRKPVLPSFSRPIEGFLDKSKRLAGGVARKFSISWRSCDTFPTGYPKAAAMFRNLTDALRAQLGQSRRWRGRGCTSAVRRIADSGSIERPSGSFLHQRTHTPDPFRT